MKERSYQIRVRKDGKFVPQYRKPNDFTGNWWDILPSHDPFETFDEAKDVVDKDRLEQINGATEKVISL